MRFAQYIMRQALLAAWVLMPLPAMAEMAARFDAETGAVVVSGLGDTARAQVLDTPDLMRLQVADQQSTRGMLVRITQQDSELWITPRFALRAGTAYVVRLDLGNPRQFTITLPHPKARRPVVSGFAPAQSVIPANTLRVYLYFSEPMARGQLKDAVVLRHVDGTRVVSPFLSLETELWDTSQTRATLLLDPGRTKQGVGPNVTGGAPLQAGQRYELVISPDMQSAMGRPLGVETVLTLQVGAPERRPIAPQTWQILRPAPGSLTPLTVMFDRIMDVGAARRLITLHKADGQRVRGEVTTDGGGWSLTPVHPWSPGHYSVVVDPTLEDVAGNTPGVPFDAQPGTMGTVQDPVRLMITIAN